MRTYPNLDVHEAFHPTSHWGGFPDRVANLRKIQNYHTAVFAKFVDRLKGMREGDGSVLDHSIILFGSNMSNSDAHNNDPLPQALDRPWRRHQGQPAPALQAGHTAREHPGDDAGPRGRAGRTRSRSSPTPPARSRKCDYPGFGIRDPGLEIMKNCSTFSRTIVAAAALVATAVSPRSHRPGKPNPRAVTASGGSCAADPPAKEDVNRRNADGSTPLQWAVYNGDVAEARRLLRAGANVSLANNYGATPMSLAAEVGNTDMLKVLLEAGANADSPNADGQTALMAVARTGNVDAAQLLLDHGATVDAKEKFGGQTALMWASARRHPEMMQLLISKGADVNAALDRSRLSASCDGRGASQEPGQRRTHSAALCRA